MITVCPATIGAVVEGLLLVETEALAELGLLAELVPPVELGPLELGPPASVGARGLLGV